jgi:capsular exopolysaccharide synthesis family protein
MVIEDYLRVVTKWWWLLILSTLVAAGSSYYTVSRAPRIYQARTTVIVGQSLSRSNPTYQDFTIGQQLAQTYVNMVRRQPILQGAAQALDLGYVPSSGNVSAGIVPGTQLIEISVRDTSPERAQALADGIAQQLILQTPGDPTDNQTRREFVEAQLRTLEGNIAATEEEIKDQQARLDAANSARAIQQYQNNIAALQQRLLSYQSSYASLLQSSDGGTNYITIVEPALLPTRPISPNVPQTVALAAAIGLALAAGGAVLIEFLDNTVKTVDDVTRVAHLPTLGTISNIHGQRYQDRLPTAYVPQSPITEAFRALRTNIQYCTVNKQLRTLLITSAAPGEGKSIIIANLAVVMAQAGLSVFLVDADLRRPVQHRLFVLDNDRGLSDALLEPEADLASYSHLLDSDVLTEMLFARDAGTEVKRKFLLGRGRLRVMTAGTVPPNPADLLGSQRMKGLIEQLMEEADIVLFDTPPVLAVTDSAVLASAVDGVLVVADSGRSKRAALRRAADGLSHVNANLIGVILNRASPGEGGYYTYRYHLRDRRDSNGSKADTDTPRLSLSPRQLARRLMEAIEKIRGFRPGKARSQAEPEITSVVDLADEVSEWLRQPRVVPDDLSPNRDVAVRTPVSSAPERTR